MRINLTVQPRGTVQAFGLCVRGEGAYYRGCELRFDPVRQRVQYGIPAEGGLAHGSQTTVYGANFGIEGVDGLDRPFRLDLIVKNDFVDACIDNRRTIVCRASDRPQGDRLFFFASGGEVWFEDVIVRSLV